MAVEMELRREESERQKLRMLQVLNAAVPMMAVSDLTETLKNPDGYVEHMRSLLKREAAKNNAVILLDHVDVDKENARLKTAKSALPLTPKRRSKFTVEPSRRSARVTVTPGKYADMVGDDDDPDWPRKARKKKMSNDEDWKGKRRSSQLSRGELKPYVPRVNSYGPIDDIPVGMWWATRMECSRDGIHRPPVSGIHGGPDGAYSVALSGGYAENLDEGYHFWYTGEGGRELRGTESDPKNLRTAPQTKDQTWTRGNIALYRSIETKNPVRVVRGFSKNKNYTSPWSPADGYRYDGLYNVVDWKVEDGVTGHSVFKFEFRRIDGQAPIQT